MLKKIKNKKCWHFFAVFFFLLVVFYLYHDLKLTTSIDYRIPEIVVSNIEVNRVINGDAWTLKSPNVSHKDNVVYATSLDVSVARKDNSDVLLVANSGVFYRHRNDLLLESVTASLTDKCKTYHLYAEEAEYQAESDTWFFKEFVRINDDLTIATAKSGVYKVKDSECLLSGDVQILRK